MCRTLIPHWKMSERIYAYHCHYIDRRQDYDSLCLNKLLIAIFLRLHNIYRTHDTARSLTVIVICKADCNLALMSFSKLADICRVWTCVKTWSSRQFTAYRYGTSVNKSVYMFCRTLLLMCNNTRYVPYISYRNCVTSAAKYQVWMLHIFKKLHMYKVEKWNEKGGSRFL